MKKEIKNIPVSSVMTLRTNSIFSLEITSPTWTSVWLESFVISEREQLLPNDFTMLLYLLYPLKFSIIPPRSTRQTFYYFWTSLLVPIQILFICNPNHFHRPIYLIKQPIPNKLHILILSVSNFLFNKVCYHRFLKIIKVIFIQHLVQSLPVKFPLLFHLLFLFHHNIFFKLYYIIIILYLIIQI